MYFFERHGMEVKNDFRVTQLLNHSFPSHLHRAYELIAVNEGALLLQVDQKQYHMEAGDLAFVFCNQIHSYATPESSDISVVLCSPEIIGTFYSAYKGFVPENSIIRLENPLNFFELKSIYAQKGMLYYICDRLLAGTEMKPVTRSYQIAALQKVFAYVDDHYSEECSLKTVAESLQYDYAYLSKLFTRLTGMHFTEYLNNYRIAQACYMLRFEKQSISDIAAKCGYTTLRTFHRNFRIVIKCSPREYSMNATAKRHDYAPRYVQRR